MNKIYAFIANGSEETECLAVIDLLKRAGIEVVLTSIHQSKTIKSSHNILITADATADEVDLNDCDGYFVPGGLPGSEYISQCFEVISALKDGESKGKMISAICAAPGVVLGRHNLLSGKRATCYPGFEKEFKEGIYVDKAVVRDNNFITAKGLGCALDLGLAIIAYFQGKDKALQIKKQIQYDE